MLAFRGFLVSVESPLWHGWLVLQFGSMQWWSNCHAGNPGSGLIDTGKSTHLAPLSHFWAMDQRFCAHPGWGFFVQCMGNLLGSALS